MIGENFVLTGLLMMIILTNDTSENEEKRYFYCYIILGLWMFGLQI